VNLYGFLARRPDMTRSDFGTHWSEVHAPLVKRMSTARRYVQYHVLDDQLPGFKPVTCDGIARLWFDDARAVAAVGTDPSYTAYAAADEPNFLDLSSLQVLATTAGRLPADNDLSILLLLRQAEGLTIQPFPSVVEDALEALKRPCRLLGWGVCLPLGPTPEGPQIDAIVELRWPNVEAWRDGWTSQIDADFSKKLSGYVIDEECSGCLASVLRVIW
jgi:uncharacterized protein (TIGR02118 family)